MSLRLLITGSAQNPNTIGAFIMRHFDGSFAWEMLTYPDAFAKLMRSPVQRLIYRFFPGIIVRKMDKLFLRQVEQFKPTVILIFKGQEISKWSLEKIRAKNIRLVNYNFDHPYIFFSRGTGNKFVRQAIPFYDLHISYSSFIAADLAKKFHVKTAWIPFGFHITPEQYDAIVSNPAPEINRVCFVGNPDSLRIDAIRTLVAAGIPIDLYGFGWERYFSTNDLLQIHPPRKAGSFWQDPLEFWKVLRQYRVQLNFFRPHNKDSHNLRTFEVPAAGGVLLTPASAEQARFFTPEKEIFVYNGTDDLVRQCKALLNSEVTYINALRENARYRSVTADYSYARRTQDLLVLLRELLFLPV